jgi:signal recognition particle subunit SRP54
MSFIKRLLGEGDIKKLIEKVTDVVSPETQAKLLEKVKKGEFNIRDLKGQFESILKLGSLNSFMSLLPGMGTNLINKDNEKESIERIRRFIFIMDSMTAQELDCECPIDDSRMIRVARGSGTSVA